MSTTTITINLGSSGNGTTDISNADKVQFTNTSTTVTITLTTPLGMNPQGATDIAPLATETNSGFTISANPAASLVYSWDDKDSKARTVRTGTIRVT
jgi:hypothetical protein